MNTNKAINRYRIYCETEGQYQYVWNDVPPIACPVNTAHTVDLTTVAIVDTVSNNSVNVIQQAGVTNGNYGLCSHSFDIQPNSTGSYTFSFPFPISISSVHFTTNASHTGDIVNCWTAPHTPVGSITSNVSVGDATVNVTQSAAQELIPGCTVTLNDGTNTCEMGRAFAIDSVNLKVTCETASSNTFSTTTPTAVQMSYPTVSNFEIADPNLISLGENHIGAAFLPANVPIMVTYQNKSQMESKHFCFFLQLLF
jgi:hypothetical protein